MKTLSIRFMAALLSLLAGPAFAHGDHAVSGGLIFEASHQVFGLHEWGSVSLLGGLALLIAAEVWNLRDDSDRSARLIRTVGVVAGGLGLGLIAAG